MHVDYLVMEIFQNTKKVYCFDVEFTVIFGEF